MAEKEEKKKRSKQEMDKEYSTLTWNLETLTCAHYK